MKLFSSQIVLLNRPQLHYRDDNSVHSWRRRHRRCRPGEEGARDPGSHCSEDGRRRGYVGLGSERVYQCGAGLVVGGPPPHSRRSHHDRDRYNLPAARMQIWPRFELFKESGSS